MSALATALLIGVAFGWTLERAGLGSARKLSAQFDFTDMTVLKVLFSAIVTAMLGVFLLSRLGILNLADVYVPETWLVPQLAGGVLFGFGFALAGLCPGTACVSAATGRGDGAAAVAGMFIGVFVAAAALVPLLHIYESSARGAWILPDLLGVPYGVVVFAIVILAVAAFYGAEHIEKRTRPVDTANVESLR